MIASAITFLFKLLLVVTSSGTTAVMVTAAAQGGVHWATATFTVIVTAIIVWDVSREDGK